MAERLVLEPSSTLVETSHPLDDIGSLRHYVNVGGYIISDYPENLQSIRRATQKPLIYQPETMDHCQPLPPFSLDNNTLQTCREANINALLVRAGCESPALDQDLIENARNFGLGIWADIRMSGCIATKTPFQAIEQAVAANIWDFVLELHSSTSARSYLNFFRDNFPDSKYRLFFDDSLESRGNISRTEMNAALGNRWHFVIPSRILVGAKG